jgi:hypothetical protein
MRQALRTSPPLAVTDKACQPKLAGGERRLVPEGGLEPPTLRL